MAIKVLALASSVTGLTDHRILNGSMLMSAGQLAARGGVLPGATSGNLSTVSAMVARVAPIKVVIANGVSAALGPYVLVSDASVDITFDAGEAAVPRVDRIIARVYDNTNDGSGSTTGSVYYLKGQASGAATALPTNSLLLYEMTIPAGASSGGGGVNFANAVDKRVYTVANGGIPPVANNTDMAAIVSPYEGMTVYRTDLDVLYVYDGTNFKCRGVPSVAASANLSGIDNPYDGLVATTRDTDALWIYSGSTWVTPKAPDIPIGRLVAQAAQTLADNTQVALTFGTSSEVYDTHNFHSESTNNSRVTPTVAGYYRVYGTVFMTSLANGTTLDLNVRTNGANNLAPGPRLGGAAGHSVAGGAFSTAQAWSISVTALVSMNGSTDYFELMARQNSDASDDTNASSQFSSVLEWEFIRPLTY